MSASRSRRNPLSRTPGGRRDLILPCLLALAALLLLPSCGNDGGPTGTDGPPVKKWTFMLYDAADVNNVYDPMDDFCQRMNSGADLNVLVLQDTRDDSARIWYVDGDHSKVVRRELGEVNTGNTETLRGFLEYAREYYPSERSILAVYGHGQGWLGACSDATNGNDYLTMEEMRAALASERGADLVLFTGACLMGAVESAYELRHCCGIYMGSENLSYYCWWDYPMEDICRTLHTNPGITTLDLAACIIDFIWEDSSRWESFDWDESLTMSAIRMDRMSDLVENLDDLAADYLADPARLREAMDEVGQDVTAFYNHYPDIYDLAREVLRHEPADSTRDALSALMASLEEAVVAECHDEGLDGSHGLTVYFPFGSHSGSTTLYGSGIGLDFIADTSWDELLEDYPYPPLDAHGTAGAPGPPATTGYCPGDLRPAASGPASTP